MVDFTQFFNPSAWGSWNQPNQSMAPKPPVAPAMGGFGASSPGAAQPGGGGGNPLSMLFGGMGGGGGGMSLPSEPLVRPLIAIEVIPQSRRTDTVAVRPSANIRTTRPPGFLPG